MRSCPFSQCPEELLRLDRRQRDVFSFEGVKILFCTRIASDSGRPALRLEAAVRRQRAGDMGQRDRFRDPENLASRGYGFANVLCIHAAFQCGELHVRLSPDGATNTAGEQGSLVRLRINAQSNARKRSSIPASSRGAKKNG